MELGLALPLILAALGVAVLAGIVKGIVGFAMPMVIISGLSTFLPPEVALAGLILPTVVTNAFQAFREGVRAAVASMAQIKVFLLVGMVALLASSQLVSVISDEVFYLALGIPVAAYAIANLAGLPMTLTSKSPRVSAIMGVIAGAFGGFSGVWGPPTVAYLTAYNFPKAEQMRIQGVIYGLGAILLVVAHSASGVLNRDTVPFSALLIVPAVLGLWIGFKVQDRMDQALFKKATLVVLAIAGANLVRRGLGY